MIKIHFFDNKDILEQQKREIQIKGFYRHFKGNFYIVEDVAKHSETGEEMVVYRGLKDNQLWIRPLSMFLDIKQTEEGYTYRFSRYHF
ncbi:DUF1653 domain-containing protein [Heyndrickxia oleronia]|uniref:DUF1653 domain-containing protein n=1 Tax=Heyndrickxia oleronia TaxID=38875 RepID=UPI003F27FE22